MAKYSRTVQIPGKSAQEIYDQVAVDLEKTFAKASMGNFRMSPHAERHEFSIDGGRMFQGKLSCRDGSIALDAELSLFAAPFRGKIDEMVDRWLSKKKA